MDHPLEARVRRILSVLLKLPLAELPEDAALGVTPHWDSLKQLEVLGALEQEFGVTIDPEQAVDLTNLAAIGAFLRARQA